MFEDSCFRTFTNPDVRADTLDPLRIGEGSGSVRSNRFRRIRFFDCLESTNSRALELAREGETEGLVVIANAQTSGRGRLGRKWISPAGLNLYMSVLFEPGIPRTEFPVATFMGALAIVQALRECDGLVPKIKWPNDVLLSGKKAAGVLTEVYPSWVGRVGLVLGMGINLNGLPSEWPVELQGRATSVLGETGQPVDRNAFAASILQHLEMVYHVLEDQGSREVMSLWKQSTDTLSRSVRLENMDRWIEGVAEDITDDGRLVLRDGSGRVHLITAGDVHNL